MSGIRFLERLRAAHKTPDSREVEDSQEVLHSVVRHVTSILNTRQGSTLLDDELGIPDFTSMGMQFTNDDIPGIERSITQLLTRYEPRLDDISVHMALDSNAATQMVFVLQANLKTNSTERTPVRLFTHLTPQGKVTVNT